MERGRLMADFAQMTKEFDSNGNVNLLDDEPTAMKALYFKSPVDLDILNEIAEKISAENSSLVLAIANYNSSKQVRSDEILLLFLSFLCLDYF